MRPSRELACKRHPVRLARHRATSRRRRAIDQRSGVETRSVCRLSASAGIRPRRHLAKWLLRWAPVDRTQRIVAVLPQRPGPRFALVLELPRIGSSLRWSADLNLLACLIALYAAAVLVAQLPHSGPRSKAAWTGHANRT